MFTVQVVESWGMIRNVETHTKRELAFQGKEFYETSDNTEYPGGYDWKYRVVEFATYSDGTTSKEFRVL